MCVSVVFVFLVFGSDFKMSVAMDRALMALTLDEEDEPFEMPDLPGFCSNEKTF